MTELCHCGKPLHYTTKSIEKSMKNLVKMKGRFVPVMNLETNKTYNVDRHYIALHGIKSSDLHTYGFEEIEDIKKD